MLMSTPVMVPGELHCEMRLTQIVISSIKSLQVQDPKKGRFLLGAHKKVWQKGKLRSYRERLCHSSVQLSLSHETVSSKT